MVYYSMTNNILSSVFCSMTGYYFLSDFAMPDTYPQPLSTAALNDRFGEFRWRAIDSSAIRILDGWQAAVGARILVPQLKGVPSYGGTFSGWLECHKEAAPHFLAAFEAVEAAGFLGDIIFYGGCWVPRRVRGGTSLSHHCLPAGETVWTPDGAKPIEALRFYNGLVWSYESGKAVPRRVTGFFANGRKPILRVNCLGHSFRCTPEHQVMVLRKKTLPVGEWIQHTNSRGQQRAQYFTEMVPAGELQKGDRVVCLRQLPSTGVVEEDGDWAEVLGLFVGDGCVGHRKGDAEYVSFAIETEDRIRGHAYDLLTRCFGEPPKTNRKFLTYYRPHIVARFASCDYKARQKHIPSAVWSWTEEAQIRFMLGYLYSDGTVGKSPAGTGGGFSAFYRFKCGSRRLMCDLKLLLTGLGFRCGRVRMEEGGPRVICGVPTLSGDAFSFTAADVAGRLVPYADSLYAERIQGSSKHNKGTSRCRGDHVVSPDFTHHIVQEVFSDGEEDTFDIEVEGSHNFITDGVVVSNSWGIACDLNPNENPFRGKQAGPRQKGYMGRVGPIFEQFGFAWGGRWKTRIDSMHVEVCCDLPAASPPQQHPDALLVIDDKWQAALPLTIREGRAYAYADALNAALSLPPPLEPKAVIRAGEWLSAQGYRVTWHGDMNPKKLFAYKIRQAAAAAKTGRTEATP